MVCVFAAVLTVLNLVFWIGILFSLPGTWLMVLVTALLKWWQPEYVLVSWTVLGAATDLAALGEVLEFVLGAAGSCRAGGSKRAAALAILGSLVRGIAGTALPVPLVGTLIGACLGVFAGSLIGGCGRGARCSRVSRRAVGGPWAGSGGRCLSSLSAASWCSSWRWPRSSDGHGPGGIGPHAPSV
jgi:uncharacterized protein